MKKKVAIIGGGTAGIFAAAFLDSSKFDVTIYEKKAALGRKFLVAGDGGFNLTHSEDLISFVKRYTPPSFLKKALNDFSNEDFRNWLFKIGIPTFVGSSGRVFPEKGIKPIEVLKAIESVLNHNNVSFEFKKTFTGWNSNKAITFDDGQTVNADFIIFALGGSSWKSTGSDGTWLNVFKSKGVKTIPFIASNCAYGIKWPEQFIENNAGKPLKNITISINNKTQKGEAVITSFGLEGNAIYGLSPQIQLELAKKSCAKVFIDFKPMLNGTALLNKLTNTNSNFSKALKDKLRLPKHVIELLKTTLTKEEFMNADTLIKYIKSFPILIYGSAPIEEAISTAGGIDLLAIDDNFELKQLNNQFCIGEMLNWNAPTGGYLIQGCASSGVYIANFLNKK